ncbi:hypothetical protein, partial [Pseudomonas savastanoi]|uniref:hypothetical protein n=1 Tax=Pseudomonas savastanoi TaxID=29438 RepID=UPI001CC205B1
ATAQGKPPMYDTTPMAVASLRSLTGRARSLAGRSARPAIDPDLTGAKALLIFFSCFYLLFLVLVILTI